MTPNDTLMEQCKNDSYEAFVAVYDDFQDPNADAMSWMKGYAAALYAERSKPRTSLSVDEVMALIPQCMERGQLNETYLRHAMTSKLNEPNTQTNG